MDVWAVRVGEYKAFTQLVCTTSSEKNTQQLTRRVISQLNSVHKD